MEKDGIDSGTKKIPMEKVTLRRIGSLDLKTPAKVGLKKAKMRRSEKQVRKTRKLALPEQKENCNFAVELLRQQISIAKQTPLKEKNKLWQTCFVNIESLTPRKLDLVKTVTSPLLQIRDQISNHNNLECQLNEYNADTINAPEQCIAVDDPEKGERQHVLSNDKMCTIADTGAPEDSIMNNTFTIDSDDSARDEIVKPNEFDETSSSIVFYPNVTNTKSNEMASGEEKRSSISRRLSKSLKPSKPQRLSDSSKISRSLRLSSVPAVRTPKIPGSKAVQLYEFLTNEESRTNISPWQEKEHNEQVSFVNSPPSSSSTPKILKKTVLNSLLKSTLKKQKNNVTFNDTVMEEGSSKPHNRHSRVKMPNFAAIHKKHFDKMENITDYHQRKNERAKLLLSGGKMSADGETAILKNNSIRKDLAPSFNHLPPIVDKCSPSPSQSFPGYTPLWKFGTPRPKSSVRNGGILKNTDSTPQARNSSRDKKVRMDISSSTLLDTSKTHVTMRKTPFKAVSTNSPSKLELKQKVNSQLLFGDGKNPSNTKTKATIANPKRPDRCKNTCTKTKEPTNNKKTAVTRFGFKVPLKTTTKEEAIRAVINKSQLGLKSSNKEEKRAVIKGVRSNRRFDLLMQMRLNK